MSKTKAIVNDISRNVYTRRMVFRVLLGSLFSLFLVYTYVIGSITFNVIARKSLENNAKILGNNISQLELTYLSNMNDVNKLRATSLGFVDASSSIFATRSINHVAIR